MTGKNDYEKYVISEIHPVSVLNNDNGESYPIADGVGFAEDMCKLLNEYNKEIRDLSDIGEKQAKFIQSKGFTFKEFIDFLKEEITEDKNTPCERFESNGRIIIDNGTKLHYIMTLEWEVSLVTILLNRFANENEQLKQREETLLCEIEDFQKLLEKNDSVCHKRVLQLLDDKISFLYKAQADMINVDDYRYGQIAFAIQCLRELRKEL